MTRRSPLERRDRRRAEYRNRTKDPRGMEAIERDGERRRCSNDRDQDRDSENSADLTSGLVHRAADAEAFLRSATASA